jgi:hypothetical protein
MVVAVLALLAGGCASRVAAPAPAYVWDPPRARDTWQAHVYGAPGPVTQQPVAVAAASPVASAPPGTWVEQQPGQGAAAAGGVPWVESSDPRWSTHRTAAPPPADVQSEVTYAPSSTVIYSAPYYGPGFGYGPAPFVGVRGGYYGGFGVGVGFHTGGFHGGGFHGGGYGGGFHGGGFHGGGFGGRR